MSKKLDKKIGTLGWNDYYCEYRVICNSCVRRGYASGFEKWAIREGHFGEFQQKCDYCSKEMNPAASSTMPELLTRKDRLKLKNPSRI